MLKNKFLWIGVAIFILILAGVGVFVLTQKKATPVLTDQTQEILTLSPEAVGLETAFRADNKAMKFTLNNAKDITAAEYQISYTKDVKGDQVPEGLIGEIDINPGSPTAGIGFREFGTCSSGVCRYDTVVSAIKLTLKISKSDGKIYQVEKTIDLPASK